MTFGPINCVSRARVLASGTSSSPIQVNARYASSHTIKGGYAIPKVGSESIVRSFGGRYTPLRMAGSYPNATHGA
jgi:hypothetical protein